jgi:hypothetical protein
MQSHSIAIKSVTLETATHSITIKRFNTVIVIVSLLKPLGATLKPLKVLFH